MPGPLSIKIFSLALLSLSVGAGGLWIAESKSSSEHTHGQRGLASSPQTTEFSKGISLVQVTIRPEAEIPLQGDQEVTLIGRVQVNADISSQLNFHWELPVGARVVSGNADGVWTNLSAGQIQETRITLVGFSREEMKLIALHGYVFDGETKLGQSAVLTSRPEDSLEMLSTAAGVQRGPAPSKPLLQGRIIR